MNNITNMARDAWNAIDGARPEGLVRFVAKTAAVSFVAGSLASGGNIQIGLVLGAVGALAALITAVTTPIFNWFTRDYTAPVKWVQYMLCIITADRLFLLCGAPYRIDLIVHATIAAVFLTLYPDA